MRRHGIDVKMPMRMRTCAINRQLGIEFAGVVQKSHPKTGLIFI